MTDRSAQDFGNPAAVRELAGAARQAARDIQTLTDAVNRDVRRTIPEVWGGETASAFEQMMYRFARATAALGVPMARYGKALDAAAETMALARLHLDEAQQFAGRRGLGGRLGVTSPRQAKRSRDAYWRRVEEQMIRRKARAQNIRHPGYRNQVIDVRGFPPTGDVYVAHHQFPVGL